jgi:hypothetical protein
VVQHYIDGARKGSGDAMKPAFHEAATMIGYVGSDLVAGPIQALYDWTDANDAAAEVEIRFTSIDVVGTAASVRLDMDNWGAHRFTDFFNLLKIDGHWTIVSKVFHLHD